MSGAYVTLTKSKMRGGYAQNGGAIYMSADS